jgi:hypothetical protein
MEKRGKHMAEVTPDEQGLFTIHELDDTADLSDAKLSTGTPDIPNYIMPSKVYDVLKWVGLILCPALATLIGTVGPAWGMPQVDAVVLTINAVGLFIGACIGASQVSSMGR